MAWVAADFDKDEYIFDIKPERDFVDRYWVSGGECLALPSGSIQKLIDKQLTWDDEPVELKDEE